MDRVSVLVATYNRVLSLLGCVECIYRQDIASEVEICIVNDGGVPVLSQVQAFFAELQMHSPSALARSVQVIDLPTNQGQVMARNMALKAATGNFISICDDDDRFTRSHLSTLQETLKNCTLSEFAYSDSELVGFSGLPLEDIAFREPFAFHHADAMLRWTNPIAPSSVYYSRRLQDTVGPFDSGMSHYWDWDFWLRVQAETHIRRFPQATLLYGIDTCGSNLSSEPVHMQTALQVFSRKHQLGYLPPSNFLQMTTDARVAEYRAKTHQVWDGKPVTPYLEIYRTKTQGEM